MLVSRPNMLQRGMDWAWQNRAVQELKHLILVVHAGPISPGYSR